MTIRVFILIALVFCACDSATEQIGDEKNAAQNLSTKEIVDVVEYHSNGAVKLQGKSQGGKRIGKWESFYPTGYRWSEANYRNGYREGDAITYYSNGMMRYQGRYYNDEQTGVWSFYDKNGMLIQKTDMDEPQDKNNFKTDSSGLR